MAEAAYSLDSPSEGEGKKDLQKEALDRLERAREWKREIAPDLMEAYFFTNPRRAREVQSTSPLSKKFKPGDEDELQTTVGTECSQDFAGLIINTFMPANFPWCKRGQGPIDEQTWEDIKDQVSMADDIILATVRASNFDAVAYSGFDPDLSLGCTAMWIAEDEITRLPHCRAIPLRKLEIDLGPDGNIGPRFLVDHIAGRDIESVVGGYVAERLPGEVREKIRTQPKQTLECVWALWRNWENKGTEEWYYCILIDKKIVHDERLQGEGSCPLIVTPWAPNPDSPWGDGPALKALPHLRVLDQKTGEVIDVSERYIDRPFSYPHDGILNFENGITSGMGYPHAPGTQKEEFIDLSFGIGAGQMREGFVTVDWLERTVKRLWFVDRPEQVGKTPPTASQWLDELVDMQKRIGLVGQKFWRDGPMAYFKRYKHLLELRGLPAFEGVPLEPFNPAIKGQEYQEVQVAGQLMGMVLSYGGVQGQALLNGAETFANIKEKLGDKLVVFNDLQAMGELMTKLIPQADVNIGGGTSGGAN